MQLQDAVLCFVEKYSNKEEKETAQGTGQK